MIAATYARHPHQNPCIVAWTGKQGLMSVVTKTYCDLEVSAASGVHQLPDNTLFCTACKEAVARVEAVNRAATALETPEPPR